MEQQFTDDARERKRNGDSDDSPSKREFQSLRQNETDDVGTLRAERDSDAEFLRTLANGIRDDAVKSDAGENECERGK